MSLHNLIYDCSISKENESLPPEKRKNPIIIVNLSPDEESLERARWAQEEAKQASYINPPSLQDQITELQITVKLLQGKLSAN